MSLDNLLNWQLVLFFRTVILVLNLNFFDVILLETNDTRKFADTILYLLDEQLLFFGGV